MAVRERARLGAVALGAGAAVLALIQILEQSVSAFSPRPVVSAMITVVVALVGATLARARSVAQRRQFLSSVLRKSPMPVASDADPYMLGVLRPRTPAADGVGPYIPRSVDEPLGRALSKRGFVLLIGEARAGKSRTAYEAVLRALPEQKLLIPYGGDALPSAVADPALRADEAVWWLDDLGRFLPKLDGPALDELLNGDHLVVSSVRADTWDALLEADGDAGEQARALLAGAHTIRMPAEHTPDELSEAARLYPDVDMTRGIGAALAADGEATHEPIKPHTEPEEPRRFDPALGLLLIVTVAAAVFLGGLIVGGGFADSTPPPIAAQVEQILGDGYRAGNKLVYYNLKADLHGLDQQSWIFVFRSPEGSDDLRIYDDEGGRLKLRLELPAGSTGKDAAQIVSHQLLNVDGFFEHELLGGYSTSKLWPAEVPFVISWNEAQERYVLAPLLPKPIQSLLKVPKPSFVQPPQIDLAPSLRDPLPLEYRTDASHTVAGYPVDLYDLVPAKGATSAVLAIAARTSKVVHNYQKTPKLTIATFSLQPLISTDDVPKLTCSHPVSGGLIVKTVPLDPFTSNPFSPKPNAEPWGFQESGTLRGTTTGHEILARSAKAADGPCNVFVIADG